MKSTASKTVTWSQAVPPDSAASVRSVALAFSPLYQQIKSLLLTSLHAGEWKPGKAIPSEMELATRYRVSQGTVRKAIDELAAENLLLRHQGKGTFVASHAAQHVQFRFLKLVPDSGQRANVGPTQRNIIACQRSRANGEVAKALNLRLGETVLQIQRVLRFDDVPIIHEAIWLPATVFANLTAERLASYQGPMYALFETEFNVRMVRAEEKIRAVAANQLHHQLLKVELATPLLSVERIAYTYHDKPMELRRGCYRTDSHHYRNDLW